MIKKLAAEFIGTFALVLFGCGAVVLAGFGVIGQEGIAWAFGLTIVAMAYGIGPISGCHVNPAVSFGAWAAVRLTSSEMLGYWAAQCGGAIVGAGVLLLIANGSPEFSLATEELGQNGYGLRLPSGQGSPGDFGLVACAVFEVVATFLFMVVILGATQTGAPSQFAGLAIGLTLTCPFEADQLDFSDRLDDGPIFRISVCLGYSLAVQARGSFERFWLRYQGYRDAEKIRLQLDERL